MVIPEPSGHNSRLCAACGRADASGLRVQITRFWVLA
jgi:hypothetical protein